jgi:hypothetical protein
MWVLAGVSAEPYIHGLFLFQMRLLWPVPWTDVLRNESLNATVLHYELSPLLCGGSSNILQIESLSYMIGGVFFWAVPHRNILYTDLYSNYFLSANLIL